MAEKYIINMPLKTTPDDTDLMIIEDAQDTKRMTWANVVKPIEDLVAAHEADNANKAHGGFKGVLLNKSSAQSISSGAFNTVTWDSVEYDSFGIYNPASPAIITIPSGVTKAIFKVGVSISAVVSGSRSIEIVNVTTGESIVGRFVTPATTHVSNAYLSAATPVLNVVAGHQYRCRAYQNSGNAIDITVYSSFFSLEVIE